MQPYLVFWVSIPLLFFYLLHSFFVWLSNQSADSSEKHLYNSHCANESCTLVQTNENMELTSAIQSEQHVKKELARRMGELQEELHNVKEQVRPPHPHRGCDLAAAPSQC